VDEKGTLLEKGHTWILKKAREKYVLYFCFWNLRFINGKVGN